jgi:hypothetical protein
LLISPKHELPALFLLRKLWAPLVFSHRIRAARVYQVMYSFGNSRLDVHQNLRAGLNNFMKCLKEVVLS